MILVLRSRALCKKGFVDVYEEGNAISETQVIVDKKTGVNYLLVKVGYGIGITPLLDKDGKPIVSEVDNQDGVLETIKKD